MVYLELTSTRQQHIHTGTGEVREEAATIGLSIKVNMSKSQVSRYGTGEDVSLKGRDKESR